MKNYNVLVRSTASEHLPNCEGLEWEYRIMSVDKRKMDHINLSRVFFLSLSWLYRVQSTAVVTLTWHPFYLMSN